MKLYGIRVVQDYDKSTGGFAEYETDYLMEDVTVIQAKLESEGYIYEAKLDTWIMELSDMTVYIDIIEKEVVEKIENFTF